MIYQNDQYYLQIVVKQGYNEITYSDCDEMIIKVGDVVRKKSTGELIFSETTQKWLYPLTYEQTSSGYKFANSVQVQAWFSTLSGNYYDSNVVRLKINTSIINRNDIETTARMDLEVS